MDSRPADETVDQTLRTSVERVKLSRDLLQEIDERLARGAAVLDGRSPEIDLRDPADGA